jgi:hypothetical protein
MGRSHGTGFPLTLRCAKCKTRWRGGGTNLEATGKTRKAYWRRGYTHGMRQTDRAIQYRCLDCRHVGWTQHIDGERLMQRRES